MPFGLEQVEGTSVIGRPAVFEQETYEFEDEEVTITSLWALYRVTAENPGDVFREWVEQLDDLAIAEIAVEAGTRASEPWLRAESINPFTPEGTPPDVAALWLWATDDDPLLLVEIDHAEGADDPGSLRVTGDRGQLAAPPSVGADVEREAGDVLLEEQGDELLLPEGTKTDIPTLPRTTGRGGSFAVIHAEDGAAAVKALLDQCEELGEDSEETGPDAVTAGEFDVVSASCVVGGAGWGFDVVAVDGEDEATLYVRSYSS